MIEPDSECTATRHSYGLVAERYAAEIGDELGGKPLDRALLGMVAEMADGELLADIGCGPGHVAEYLRGLTQQVIALDLSPSMCVIGSRGGAENARNAVPFIAADMAALPIASGMLTGIVCFYAVIHLDADRRAAAYGEFARALRAGGHALIAFHTSDVNVPVGGSTTVTEWWGFGVSLTFRFLDPAEEISLLAAAGLRLVARIDRAPYPDSEHPSERCYLLVRRHAGLPTSALRP